MRQAFWQLLAFFSLLSYAFAAPKATDKLTSAKGELGQDIQNLVNNTSAALAAFQKVVTNIANATNDNGILRLFGEDLLDKLEDDSDGGNTTSAVEGKKGNVTCPDMAVLFARGTDEPGNMGIFTGPSLASSLRVYLTSPSNTTMTAASAQNVHIAVQGVPYAATVSSFLSGGSPLGARTLAYLANTTATLCPNVKLVLAGYSQGAQVVRNALTLSNTTSTSSSSSLIPASKISSVLLFGDPQNGTALPLIDPSRVQSFCNTGDVICNGQKGDVITADHLTYSRDAPAAAAFVMQRSGLGISGGAGSVTEGMNGVPMVQMSMGESGSSGLGTRRRRWFSGLFDR